MRTSKSRVREGRGKKSHGEALVPHGNGGGSGPADALRAYRQKRDPVRTSEPFSTAERKTSSGQTRAGRFVVHLHDATRAHYDVRLQVGGTLKSFAVPKGPSLDPDDKRLAVQTEDHPLEYLDFEDVIPEDNYGAGPMIVWDTGGVRYLEGTAEEGISRGKIDFELSGFKLSGRFALVETSRRRGAERTKQPQWLLIKKSDAHSSKSRDIISERPQSVLSGMTVEELVEKQKIADTLERRAAALGAPEANVDVKNLVPMLCSLGGAALHDPELLYELKLDGVRIVADKHGDAVALRYRWGRAASSTYPEIARAVASLAPSRVVLDGEIVAFDERGKPDFQRLLPRIQARRPYDVLRVQSQIPVVYVVFDILAIGARDLRRLPLRARKELLMELVKGAGLLRALDHLEGDGRRLLEFCKAEKLEGIVAKRLDSPYRPGPRRSDDWVKIKCERDDDFVVVGWVTGRGGRNRLGALDLASYVGDRLVYRGQVGSGFDERTITALLDRLAPLETDRPPAAGELPHETGVRRFARPELVVSVRFDGWSEDEKLWHPVFRGVREDVDPKACRATPSLDEAAEALIETGGSSEETTETAGDDSGAGRRTKERPNARWSERVTLSNLEKVFWPDEGYTKGDLIEYYAAVADVMLPFLRGRPVVLVRYPDGIAGKSFYQWRAPHGTPEWIRTLELYDDEKIDERGENKSVFLVDDVDSLVHIANLGCIPLHVLASRETSPDSCDFITIDFDVGERSFRDAVVLGIALRELLDELGLVGFPKTSGQKGLHVLVPLGPGVGFDAAKLLVELVGRLVTDTHPEIATMERRVGKRGPRVYVDTGQTGQSRTIVAPYSVRAHPGATVSTPLYWEELHVALDPSRFTMMTLPARIAESGDPMRGFFDVKPDVAAAVRRLEKKLRE